jgi:hypothetical protein
MMTRRTLLAVGLIAPVFAPLADAGGQPSTAQGLDRRTLANVEEKWITSRFTLDQWMETGRLKPREVWPKVKGNIVRGSFNLGYREAGVAEKIVNGVRTGKIADRDG